MNMKAKAKFVEGSNYAARSGRGFVWVVFRDRLDVKHSDGTFHVHCANTGRHLGEAGRSALIYQRGTENLLRDLIENEETEIGDRRDLFDRAFSATKEATRT